MPERLGRKLKELRLEKGMTLAKVGKSISKSHNFISELENGKRTPSSETLRDLAKLYEYDEDDLFRLAAKLPLSTLEYLESDVHLQNLLADIQRRYEHSPEKMDEVREKVLKLYQDFLDSED